MGVYIVSSSATPRSFKASYANHLGKSARADAWHMIEHRVILFSFSKRLLEVAVYSSDKMSLIAS